MAGRRAEMTPLAIGLEKKKKKGPRGGGGKHREVREPHAHFSPAQLKRRAG